MRKSEEEKKLLKKIADEVAEKIIFTTKEVLTLHEVSAYLGLSLSTIYRMTSKREIPHYKPTGKIVYFDRKEIDEWAKANRIATANEIQDKIDRICKK